jgi:penicillin-binding protein 1A
MSPLDMASGAQTLANGGVHMQPYFVDRIEGPRGVVYEHNDPGQTVFSKEVADKAVGILKGVLTKGTARRSALDGERPAAGKTGTQDDNTNAWFVGMTPQLTTAVWVGDPKAYTPMVNVPEFVAKKVPRVQGGTFPAAIWKSFTDDALAGEPVLDWDPAPPIARSSVRLYLPGVDCVARVVSGTLPRRVVGNVSPAETTTTTLVPGATTVVTVAPETTVTETSVPVGGRPVVSIVDAGTTILPSNTNPFSPVPSVDPNNALVFDCAKSLPGWVQTTIAGG